jgi:hypothetical protein
MDNKPTIREAALFLAVAFGVPFVENLAGIYPAIGLLMSAFLFFANVRKALWVFLLFWYTLILSDSFQFEFGSVVKPVLMILLMVYAYWVARDFFPQNFILRALAMFLVMAGILIFSSPEPWLSFQKYSSYLLLYLCVPPIIWVIMSSHRDAPRFLFYFIVGIVGFSLLYIVLSPYASSHGGRIRGIFGNPNGFAMFSLFSFLFVQALRATGQLNLSHRWHIGYQILVFSAILLSGSRAALSSLLLFYLLSRFRTYAALVGFFIVGILVFFYDDIMQITQTLIRSAGYAETFRLEGAQGLETGSGRLVAWRFAWEEINRSFFFGRGWTYDEIWIFGPIQKVLLNLNHQGGVHNTFLILWLNNGLIGLLLFLLGWFAITIRAGGYCGLAFPVLYAGLFQANFEPWLGASLNPYTVIFIAAFAVMLFPSLQTRTPDTPPEPVKTDVSTHAEPV